MPPQSSGLSGSFAVSVVVATPVDEPLASAPVLDAESEPAPVEPTGPSEVAESAVVEVGVSVVVGVELSEAVVSDVPDSSVSDDAGELEPPHPQEAKRKRLPMAHVRITAFDRAGLMDSNRDALEIARFDWSIGAMTRSVLAWCATAVLLCACGEKDVDASGDTDGAVPNEGDPCEPDPDGAGDTDDEPPCADGYACEANGDGHICAAPIEIHGIVLDAIDETPIEGARVTALDETGAPVGSVSISDADGRYVLTVTAGRNDDGSIADTDQWTLFAAAIDYQAFPGGLRPAIPINAADALMEDVGGEDDDDDDDGDGSDETQSGRWVIENPSTNVGLLPLPEGQAGGRTVSGVVGGDSPGGTLVVAEGPQPPARYTIADADGHYAVFNVPAGPHTMVGYRGGLDVLPASIDGGADVEDADLDASEGSATAVVRGSVNIVNAPGGSETSVVLVPVSTYNDNLERGPVPRGLRAPEAPATPSVSGEFEIDGVPPGRYKVLAAFENDALVRDPDTSIAGTAIVEIEVDAADIDLAESFKITEGLAVVSPGAETPETVTGTPTFVFADDSSEDRYEVLVFDAFGELLWADREVPGVSGSDVVEVTYGGPALDAGQYYQFRATSIRETPNSTTAISRTEDLRGVFIAGDE